MVSPLLTASPDEEGPEASWIASCAAAVEQYESYGWTIVTDDQRVLVVGDNVVSAVELDRGLGGEVQHYLSTRLLGGPVIELPGRPTRWIFLASGVEDMSPQTFVRIRARRGIVHMAGTFIPLPPSRLTSGDVVWKQPPIGKMPSLPQFASVAGALRAVTEGVGLS